MRGRKEKWQGQKKLSDCHLSLFIIIFYLIRFANSWQGHRMTLITASNSPFPSVPARAPRSFASYSTSSSQLSLGKDCGGSSDDYKFMKNFTGCFVKLTQIVAETYLCEFYFFFQSFSRIFESDLSKVMRRFQEF